MKASELIKILKERIEVDGDLDIEVNCNDMEVNIVTDYCIINEILFQDNFLVIR